MPPSPLLLRHLVRLTIWSSALCIADLFCWISKAIGAQLSNKGCGWRGLSLPAGLSRTGRQHHGSSSASSISCWTRPVSSTTRHGDERSVYCLRHTAICMRIILSHGKVNIFNLAKNAGTSVEQIERFYAKHLPLSREMAKNLQSFGEE